ncbi:MAG: hypothetical protein R2731_03505 [Nocardioides sp.]
MARRLDEELPRRPASPWSCRWRARSTAPARRDWAAKGTALLGVKAVVAEVLRADPPLNLIGMGVLPLQFPAQGRTPTPSA